MKECLASAACVVSENCVLLKPVVSLPTVWEMKSKCLSQCVIWSSLVFNFVLCFQTVCVTDVEVWVVHWKTQKHYVCVCERCVCCFRPLSMFDLSHWAPVLCAANSHLSHHCGFFFSKMSPRPSTSHLCLYRWPHLYGSVLIPRLLLSHVINHPYMIIVHLLWSNIDVLYS